MTEIMAVGAIIRDGAGRIVVVRRKNAPSANRWSVPGGRVEPTETLHDAVVREVREETGLEVRVHAVAGRLVLSSEQGDQATAAATFAVTDFFATPLDSAGELIAGDDALEARWVTRQELANMATTPRLVALLDEWGGWDL